MVKVFNDGIKKFDGGQVSLNAQQGFNSFCNHHQGL